MMPPYPASVTIDRQGLPEKRCPQPRWRLKIVTNDTDVDELGPVDYIVVEFPADKADFSGAMIAELSSLIERDLIRVLDLLILKKDLDGTVEGFESHDFGDTDLAELLALETELALLLAADDVEAIGAALEPGSVAVQGSLPDRLRPAPDARRHRHRVDRHAVRHRLHLHPRRISPPGQGARAGDQGSVRQRRSSASRGSSASQYKLECYVHRGAGAYICGEETGLLEALEGKRGWPRNKPPFPAIAGAFAKPTVINNVETLCCVPPIIERGPGVVQDRWARQVVARARSSSACAAT